MMTGAAFYLGTHRPNWLATLDVPLFVSHRQLMHLKTLPRAATSWALDSGAFSEISTHGRWTFSADDYVEAVRRYERQIGNLDFAAIMDHMCEPFILEKTGCTVEEHQRRTVASYLELRGRGPFVPVLQGWTIGDYERCVEMYAAAGVDLMQEPRIGLGSVCRRQGTEEVGRIVTALQPLRLHAFGAKLLGLERYGHLLASADSMAWSYRARRSPPLRECAHRSCANCARFALQWRGGIVRLLDAPSLFESRAA